MSSAGGLSRRRVGATASTLETTTTSGGAVSPVEGNGGAVHAGTALEGGHKVAYDPRDLANEDTLEGSKLPKLTLLEEILLLGLKDKQVGYSSPFCYYLSQPLCVARAIYPFGTITFLMPYAAAFSLNSHFVAASPWSAIHPGDACPFPTG